MDVINIDINKLYKAWRAYLLENSDAAHFGMVNEKTIAEFPYANLSIVGTPTNQGTLMNDEITVDFTVQTDVYNDNPRDILSLYGMDTACWEFFQKLGFRRMGEAIPIQVSNSNVTRISSRFILQNFTGNFLVDIDSFL